MVGKAAKELSVPRPIHDPTAFTIARTDDHVEPLLQRGPEFLEAHGHIPIPPYLEREDTADGVMVVARLPRRELSRFTPYLVR